MANNALETKITNVLTTATTNVYVVQLALFKVIKFLVSIVDETDNTIRSFSLDVTYGIVSHIPEFTKYAELGDTIDYSIDVVYAATNGGQLEFKVTNNTAHTLKVYMAEIERIE